MALLLSGACVPAGLPSPADDFIKGILELNDLLVTNPPATFFLIEPFCARNGVRTWTGVPVTVGVGHTKTLAKVANDLAKCGAMVRILTSEREKLPCSASCLPGTCRELAGHYEPVMRAALVEFIMRMRMRRRRLIFGVAPSRIAKCAPPAPGRIKEI